MRGGLAALLVLTAPAAAGAEAPDFCSDRPGLTTGTCLAAPGTFQLETSFAEWSRSDGAEELALGSSRLRYGVDGRTDLHLAITPHVRVHEEGATEHGIGDLSIAVKHVVTRADASVAIAIMPFVKLPTGSRALSNRRWEGGLLLPVEAPLSGAWSVTLTPEINWSADSDGDGHHARYALAATLGVDLSRRWSASLDGLVAREKDGTTLHEGVASVSLAFLASPTLRFDAQADAGLTRDTPDIKLTSGFAVRF